MYYRNIHSTLITHFLAFIFGVFIIRSTEHYHQFSSECNHEKAQIPHIDDKHHVTSSLTTNLYEGSSNIPEILDITRSKIQRELQNYAFSKSGASKLEDLVLESGGRPLRSVVITSWRSGSTFLGEILNAMPGSFYHYEPLRNYEIQQIRGPPHAKPATRTLINMLKCNYNNKKDLKDYFEYKKNHMQQFRHNTRLWEFCKYNKELCFNQNFTTEFCKLFPFQTMKLVRFRLLLVDDLLKDETLNVKVVLLIRDPRAVLQSRHHHTFCPPAPDCWDPGLVCSDMVSDYMTALRIQRQYPDRLTVVRYEDLALNPKKISHNLYDFFGLNVLPSLDQYIETHTTADPGCSSSTYRMSSTNVFKWKELLDFNYANTIQAACKKSMMLWGYRPADNATHMQSKDFKPIGEYPVELLTT